MLDLEQKSSADEREAYKGTLSEETAIQKEHKKEEIAYSFEYSLADFTTTEALAPVVAALKKLAIAAENFKKYVPATTTTPEA